MMVCVKFQIVSIAYEIELQQISLLFICIFSFRLVCSLRPAFACCYPVNQNEQMVVGPQHLMVLQPWSDWTHEVDLADLILADTPERHRHFLEAMTNTLTVCRMV